MPSGPLTIPDGGLATQDPNDVAVYEVDWDDFLAEGVTVTTSTWTTTAKRPTDATALTTDNTDILGDSRSTQIRISGGQVGGLYEVANKIVTSESPTQTIERSFRLLIENK